MHACTTTVVTKCRDGITYELQASFLVVSPKAQCWCSVQVLRIRLSSDMVVVILSSEGEQDKVNKELHCGSSYKRACMHAPPLHTTRDIPVELRATLIDEYSIFLLPA